MATTNDLKNGMVLNLDNQLWSVVEFQHVKPGKGPAFVRTKLKSVTSGKVVDKTFNAGTKVETANVDKRTMQFLYNDGTDYVFMDPDTFDQIPVSPDVVGDAAKYMLENQEAVIARHDGNVLYVELPASVVLDDPFSTALRQNAAAQQKALEEAIKGFDVVITTALVPGRPAPRLVTAAAVQGMRPGSVIVDLAGETGGNCELTEPGQTVVKHDVTICSPLNLPATMPEHASELYSKNVAALLELMLVDGKLAPDFSDQVLADSCVTRVGAAAEEGN